MTTSDFFSNPAASGFPERQVMSVSQLNRRAKQLLETHLPLLWVEGELSNVSVPSSGHWYFTLKDSEAQVRCAMFRNRNMMVKFRPQQGQHVLIRARVSLYEGRGDYQIIAEHMEEAGAGALQRAFDELKAKLAHEGLFDEQYKKQIPLLPKHIAVITSPTGAAIRDILNVLERRFPAIPVTILPVAVQGKEAAPQIVRALELANRANLFDVIILGRGGGSLEDLWPFNEETVARAIFASNLPVVSAVGHEVDFTIADFVADLRAPTPSAAAELVTPDGEDWLDKFIGFEVLLEEALRRKLDHWQQKIQWLRSRLRHPKDKLEQQSQRCDALEMRLKNAIQKSLTQAQNQLNTLMLRQKAQHPQTRLLQLTHRFQLARQQLIKAQSNILIQKNQRFNEAVRMLNTLSPLNTLERGFALVTQDNGEKPVTASNQVKPGEKIKAKLAKGELLCSVEKILT
ncbi:exodeoxyribonuclease VII large subunit [Cellvibrio sp.]|uniref:exodeoxyribonuclease VII large subunit n=1 Tax=Cellvibrio sp. TaxID=1965322 RepID=UPI0039648753